MRVKAQGGALPRRRPLRRAAAAFGILVCCTQSNFGNPNYVPNVPDPPYAPGAGPVVWFDAWHDNAHRLDATYRPFARLLEAAGYRPQILRAPLDAAQLQGGLLVLVLPRTPLSTAEIAEAESYVAAGGGLMLVTDHPNFPVQVQPLGFVLGIDFVNVGVANALSPYRRFLITPAAHFTSSGIPLVKTYDGSAVTSFPGAAATTVLPFGVEAVDDAGQSLAGLGRSVAVQHGLGRVYAAADAQMFSSICFLSCNNVSGFGDEGAEHNEAHLLRVMRWLEGEG